MKSKLKKQVINFLVSHRINSIASVYNNKVNKIDKSNIQELPVKIKKEYVNYWSDLLDIKMNHKYLEWMVKHHTNVEFNDFVPETHYYSLIEPLLNNPDFSLAYSDKNFYDLFFDKVHFPRTFLRRIDNKYLDENYNYIEDKEESLKRFNSFIIKPSVDTGGGKNIWIFSKEKNKFYSNTTIFNDDFISNRFSGDFIIQEVIQQHKFFSQFNPSSVNTIRMLVYKSVKTNSLHLLHAILRIGRHGEVVDNSRAGGYSVGINSNAKMNKFALNKHGEKFEFVNGQPLNIEDSYMVPHFNQMKSLAFKLALKNIHCRLIGFDFTIDSKNHPICIEINNLGNEINFYQLNNGPLFKEFLEEIKEYVFLNKSKIYLKYSIK